MITIEDNDSPIIAAGKIIHGTRPYNPTPAQKAIVKALFGKDVESDTQDMFDLEEIKEIADYLIVYYNAHKNDECYPAEDGEVET